MAIYSMLAVLHASIGEAPWDVTLVQDLGSDGLGESYNTTRSSNSSLTSTVHKRTKAVKNGVPDAPQYDANRGPDVVIEPRSSVAKRPALGYKNGGAPQNATSGAPLEAKEPKMPKIPPEESEKKSEPERDKEGRIVPAPKEKRHKQKTTDKKHKKERPEKDENGELPIARLADPSLRMGESFAWWDTNAERRENEVRDRKWDAARERKAKQNIAVGRAKEQDEKTVNKRKSKLTRKELVTKRESSAKKRVRAYHKEKYEGRSKKEKSAAAKAKAKAAIGAPLAQPRHAPTSKQAAELNLKQKTLWAEAQSKHKSVHQEKSSKNKQEKRKEKIEAKIAFPKPVSGQQQDKKLKHRKAKVKPHTTSEKRLRKIEKATEKRQKELDAAQGSALPNGKSRKRSLKPEEYQVQEKAVKREQHVQFGSGGVPKSSKLHTTKPPQTPPEYSETKAPNLL